MVTYRLIGIGKFGGISFFLWLALCVAGCGKSASDTGLVGASGLTHPTPHGDRAGRTASGGDAYQGPVAFVVMAEGLSASFIDHSSGTVTGQQWVFGDGATSTAASPVHVYSREGSYEVTETITDSTGRSSARTLPVRVMPLPPELHNGVERAGLTAVDAYELQFYSRIPTGATHLEFELTGSVGDIDMFVRHGSMPTETTYDCHRPQDGHMVICAFDLPESGPYYATLMARKSFNGATLKASWREVSTAQVAADH